MADDFGFGSPVVDDDLNPALQDFLQREQGQLAELGEDDLGFSDQPSLPLNVRRYLYIEERLETLCCVFLVNRKA